MAKEKTAKAPAPKKIPKFQRQNRHQKRVGDAWRYPRGIDNKLRMARGGVGEKPSIGYRKPRATRGTHPCGLREKLVYNANDLNSIDKSTAARISATVGAKKRKEIFALAKKLSIKVL